MEDFFEDINCEEFNIKDFILERFNEYKQGVQMMLLKFKEEVMELFPKSRF